MYRRGLASSFHILVVFKIGIPAHPNSRIRVRDRVGIRVKDRVRVRDRVMDRVRVRVYLKMQFFICIPMSTIAQFFTWLLIKSSSLLRGQDGIILICLTDGTGEAV